MVVSPIHLYETTLYQNPNLKKDELTDFTCKCRCNISKPLREYDEQIKPRSILKEDYTMTKADLFQGFKKELT